MIRRALPFAIALLLSTIAGAESPTLTERAEAIESASQQPDGTRVVVGHLSRVLGVSTEVLRARRAENNLNWGEVLIASHLSRSTELPFGEIVAEVRAGKTWEDIAETHHVDLPHLVELVRQSQDTVEQHSEDRAPHITGDQPRPAPGHSSGGGAKRNRRGHD